MRLKERLAAAAAVHGFARLGVADVSPLHGWAEEVAARRQAGWLPDNWDGRRIVADPAQCMPGARAVVVLAMPSPPWRWPAGWTHATCAAHYAALDRAVAGAESLAGLLRAAGYAAAVYPRDPRLPLKALAERAGLGRYGWQGLLLVPEHGSFVTLVPIVTDAPLSPDRPISDPLCTGCGACMAACPTGAVPVPGRVAIGHCLREMAGWEGEPDPPVFPEEYRCLAGTSLLGCELCQQACPLNARAKTRGPALDPDALDLLSLERLLVETPEEYAARQPARARGFGLHFGSQAGLLSRACLAAGNTGRRTLAGPLSSLAHHPAAAVREHARWAISRLAG